MTIEQRMQRLHEILRREQEQASNAQDRQHEEESGWNELNWSDFGDWNDSPAF
jgi:hypothetical protein